MKLVTQEGSYCRVTGLDAVFKERTVTERIEPHKPWSQRIIDQKAKDDDDLLKYVNGLWDSKNRLFGLKRYEVELEAPTGKQSRYK